MSAGKFETVLPDEPVFWDVEQRPSRQSETEAILPVEHVRVLVCDPIPSVAVERMREGGLLVDEWIGLSPAMLEELIGDYDAVVVRSATRLGAQQLAAAQRLRLIVRAGVGTDNIDLAAAASQGIAVLNTPKASTGSVAELALGMLLALARRIPQADAAVKSGGWPKKEFSDGIELAGKTLGIIGVGRIGGALGRCAAALGMVVVGADKAAEPVGRFEGLALLSLEALLACADFVSIHTPPSKAGRAVIGKKEIARMKDGVLLVNCARGGLVDEEALLTALDSGKVRGAALDVFAGEPPSDLRLARHPHVICTPHLGASTREAQARIGVEIAQLMLEQL
ncbi:NAD(P)-dependent oxidoreductase [Pseudogulbenkiania ferrooxidans]|uniref:D-isomer specific 2-hydroxyacid dehydrogenase NAD-binding n=1 Tax=Pseudogulbenkiania ferrooxidans 2002 TaxID=279714 RepID=B9Z038_9NEIS|nr:NAD(P)-dependent oxidoreductase [Pseudogulbenkiania ferrooxidans]EEG09921.1 D-isomer specific 2-hydroxyacid dehydrogenase NAD-binding [Pseudogulbenkiania ferrooxidans 2002]